MSAFFSDEIINLTRTINQAASRVAIIFDSLGLSVTRERERDVHIGYIIYLFWVFSVHGLQMKMREKKRYFSPHILYHIYAHACA